MHPLSGLPARTLAAGSLGVALVLALNACSSSAPESAASPASPRSSAPTPAASPSTTPSTASPAAPSSRPSPTATSNAPAVPEYVDTVPAGVRAQYFTQGSVPASYADWISLSPQQQTSDGRVELVVDRRLPACGKENAPHYPSDQHAAGFASRLFQSDGFIVARQLTVYHSLDQAKTALQEVVEAEDTCSVYAGAKVDAAQYGRLRNAGELDVPQHDRTVAGETSLSAGGAGVSWWTVAARDGNAVVLTRVVDPKADVDADGYPSDSIAFRQEVLSQANTSSKVLDAMSG